MLDMRFTSQARGACPSAQSHGYNITGSGHSGDLQSSFQDANVGAGDVSGASQLDAHAAQVGSLPMILFLTSYNNACKTGWGCLTIAPTWRDKHWSP